MKTFLTLEGVPQTLEDLGRKFNSTYVKLAPGFKDPAPFTIRGFDNRGVYIRNLATGDDYIKPLGEVGVVQIFPPSGVYSLEGGGVALIRRLPARQWTEGMSITNTSVFINGVNTPRWGSDVARQAYKDQKDVSLDEGLSMVKEGTSVRLNQKYWLRQEKGSTTITLLRTNARLCSWANGMHFWTPKGKMFMEELKDELRFHV